MIEILVVVIVLGILAAAVIPKFATAQQDTNLAATAEDLKVIEAALQMYVAKHGSYPRDVNRTQYPRELAPYFKNGNPFEKPTPLGGKYDYEGPPNWNPVQISMRTESQQVGHTEADAQRLDDYMDDGNLRTGLIRRDGNRTYYIIDYH
jgi:type II secretory pathway pseudopilin PulG